MNRHTLLHHMRAVANTEHEFYDETLRDGIQCPSVVDPTIEDKIRLLHLMDSLGIHWADIGLPGAGARAVEDVETLAREIVDNKLTIKASCAARTSPSASDACVNVSPVTMSSGVSASQPSCSA